MGRCLKVDFEVVRNLVAERRVMSFRVVTGDVVADFLLGFGQASEAAAVEQFGFEAAPKRFGVGVVIAVARFLMLCTAPCWASKSLNRVAV
jgi:hypothetical protein